MALDSEESGWPFGFKPPQDPIQNDLLQILLAGKDLK
jgi:hypothetical protein